MDSLLYVVKEFGMFPRPQGLQIYVKEDPVLQPWYLTTLRSTSIFTTIIV